MGKSVQKIWFSRGEGNAVFSNDGTYSSDTAYHLRRLKSSKIFVNNQLVAEFFFSLFKFSTYFEQPSAHHEESQMYQLDLELE